MNERNKRMEIEEIRKINLGSDEVLVLKVPISLRPEHYERIYRQMKQIFPKNRTIILEPGYTLEAICAKDLEAVNA